MDGMDRMAASQAIIAATTYAFWFLTQGGTEIAVFCAVVAASSYGFLWHNWRPATIFMGDVGSISLGAIFALLLIVGHNRFDMPVLSSVMLLFVFIVDSTLTLVLRAARGEKVWQAHSGHFYQRLAHAGYSHSYIVIAYIGLMVVCSLAATVSLYWQALLLPIWMGLAGLILALACWVNVATKLRA
jgi:Fuc2NAc and GlcNAc transferase